MTTLLVFPADLVCEVIGKWLIMKDIAHLDTAYCHASQRKVLHDSIFKSPHLRCQVFPNCHREELNGNAEWILKKGIRVETLDLADSKSHVSWLKYIQHFGQWVKCISFNDHRCNRDEDVFEIARLCVNLSMFMYTDCCVSTPLIDAVGGCTQLECLVLASQGKETDVDPADVSIAKKLTLKSVALTCSARAEAAILRLIEPDTVQTLHVNITTNVADWSCFKHLRSLGFSRHLLDSDIPVHPVLGLCPWVHSLDLSVLRFVSDDEIALIVREVSQIRCLNLQNIVEMTDASLYNLAEHHRDSLESLYLYKCEEISGVGVNHVLTHCTKLRALSCNHSADLNYTLLGGLTTFVADFPTVKDTIHVWDVIKQLCHSLQHLYVFFSHNTAEFQTHLDVMTVTTHDLAALRCVHVVGALRRESRNALVGASAQLPPGKRLVSEQVPMWHDLFGLPI